MEEGNIPSWMFPFYKVRAWNGNTHTWTTGSRLGLKGSNPYMPHKHRFEWTAAKNAPSEQFCTAGCASHCSGMCTHSQTKMTSPCWVQKHAASVFYRSQVVNGQQRLYGRYRWKRMKRRPFNWCPVTVVLCHLKYTWTGWSYQTAFIFSIFLKWVNDTKSPVVKKWLRCAFAI